MSREPQKRKTPLLANFSRILDSRISVFGDWGFPLVCLILLLLLHSADQLTLGTLLGFGPRWVFLVAFSVALVLASIWRRQALAPIIISIGLVGGPLMGLCIPWQNVLESSSANRPIRLITCNTTLGRAENPLRQMMIDVKPDIVCLQEWSSQRETPACIPSNWQHRRVGDLMIASRFPIRSSGTLHASTNRWTHTVLMCELETTGKTIRVFCLHLPTPRDGLEAVLSKRWHGLGDLAANSAKRRVDAEAAAAWIDSFAGIKLIAGDLNLVPESTIYRETFSKWQNAYQVAGFGWGGTYFTRWHSIRIDHVLGDDAWRILRCEVGADVGSDHRPLIAEVVLRNSQE